MSNRNPADEDVVGRGDWVGRFGEDKDGKGVSAEMVDMEGMVEERRFVNCNEIPRLRCAAFGMTCRSDGGRLPTWSMFRKGDLSENYRLLDSRTIAGMANLGAISHTLARKIVENGFEGMVGIDHG